MMLMRTLEFPPFKHGGDCMLSPIQKPNFHSNHVDYKIFSIGEGAQAFLQGDGLISKKQFNSPKFPNKV
jgi:hypothetical protein